MSYKTNLHTTVVDNTIQKQIPIERARLKAQLDDFATFQWRGHDMFDDFGCFIINDKNGSLKFYNGPSFTNQYAKTQFSSSVNGLLGIDFKQQTIPMKVGLYWFTIEEYQQFLDCIGPYQVNYITFNFDDKYGYLVKSGKIADSTKYIVGSDKEGRKRYYTELDLTWEILGDACVRSNLAYEYNATNDTIKKECIWTFNPLADMQDTSLLDTPLVFEIPCCFTESTASLQLEAILPATDDSEPPLFTKLLFDLQLQNLSVSADTINGLNATYHVSNNITEGLSPTPLYCCEQGIFDIDSSMTTIQITDFTPGDYDNYKIIEGNVNEIIISFPNSILYSAFTKSAIDTQVYYEPNSFVVNFNLGLIILDTSITDWSQGISVGLAERKSIADIIQSYSVKNFMVEYKNQYFDKIIRANTHLLEEKGIGTYYLNTMIFNSNTNNWIAIQKEEPITINAKKSEIDSSLYSYLTFDSLSFSDVWSNIDTPLYQLYFRYDSETGLIYIQNGSQTSWYLLNYQTDNTNGQSLLKSSQVFKYKIPGKFNLSNRQTTEWKFKLTYSGIDLDLINSNQLNQAIIIYSRKNII